MFPPPRPPRPPLPDADPSAFDRALQAAGVTPREAPPRGFFARINAQPDADLAVYGYTRVDDGADEFPELPEGQYGEPPAFSSDGAADNAPAYEVNLSTSVPTDGSVVVWLEPLGGVAGYGFTYTAGSAAVDVYGQVLDEDLLVTAACPTNERDETTPLALPGPGVYDLTVVVHAAGVLTTYSPGSGHGFLLAALTQEGSSSDYLFLPTDTTRTWRALVAREAGVTEYMTTTFTARVNILSGDWPISWKVAFCRNAADWNYVSVESCWLSYRRLLGS